MLSRLLKKSTARDDAIPFCEPSPRFCALTSSSADELYLYNGYVEKFMKAREQLSKTIQVYDSFIEAWREIPTTGSPPIGLYMGAATYCNPFLYTYGGFNGVSRQSSLHQLNTKSYTWTQLSSQHENGPMRKSECSMINFDGSLLLCGGYGFPLRDIQQESQFTKNNRHTNGIGWTNEIHMFNIANGTWSSPHITGTRPPPCSSFSLTKISPTQAVFFGGICDGVQYNHIFILDLPTMKFTEVTVQDSNPLPKARNVHAAVCLGYGSDSPQLLIHGGLDTELNALNDLWCFCVNSRTWKEISVPDMQPRFFHSAAAFNTSPEIMEVLLFGGCPAWPKNFKSDDDLVCLADTTIIRFEKRKKNDSQTEWIVTEVLDKTRLENPRRLAEKLVMLRQLTCNSSRSEVEVKQQEANVVDAAKSITEARMQIQQAEERAQQSEARAQESEARAQESEARAQESEARAQESEARAHDSAITIQESEARSLQSEERAQKFEAKAQQSEVRAQKTEVRAKESETRAIKSEARAQEAEARAQKSEARAQESETRAHESEARAKNSEVRAQETEARAKDSEARAQKSEARAQESETRAQKAEDRAQKSEARAKESEARAQVSEARAQESEARAQESEARAQESDKRAWELEERAHNLQSKASKLEARAQESEKRAWKSETRAQQSEVRAQKAEERAQKAEVRAHQSHSIAQESESRAQESEARAQESEARAQDSEVKAQDSEARAQESEARAQESEARAQESEARAQESEARAQESEARAQESEARAQNSEARAQDLEARAQKSEARAQESEARAQDSEAKAQESEARAQESEARAQESEARAQESKARAQELEVRAQDSEVRAQEYETRALESEARAHQLEATAQELQKRAEDLENRLLTEQDMRARDAVEKLGNDSNKWLVQRAEIHITKEKLGRGGWGKVKVAEFRGLKVAAKVLFKELQFPYYHNIFIREMNMASCVQHPNLVQFIGASIDEEKIILMELMPTSLRQHLERSGPSIPSAAFRTSASLDVARALNYLHLMKPQPLIHRDISSANVLLEPLPNQRWRAKVTDYGSVNLQNKLTTKSPGNPVYSAPESSDPALQSTKMDIFSFGVLLLEMCTALFPEVANRETMIHSISDEHWVDMIRECIHEDQIQRPSASQIIAQLAAW